MQNQHILCLNASLSGAGGGAPWLMNVSGASMDKHEPSAFLLTTEPVAKPPFFVTPAKAGVPNALK